MAINKFQRSWWTFDLRSLIMESHQYVKTIVFSQIIGPNVLKFHVKTSYDKLALNLCKIFCSHDQDGCHAHIW